MTTTPGVSLPRCLVCDKPLSLVACFDGWCDVCTGKAQASLLALRDLTRADLTIVADIFRQVHEPFLAEIITGGAPFEVEPRPTPAELERLTDGG